MEAQPQALALPDDDEPLLDGEAVEKWLNISRSKRYLLQSAGVLRVIHIGRAARFNRANVREIARYGAR